VSRLTQRALEPNARVVVKQDPRAALEMLLAGAEFDLILCDVMMPGMSGLEMFDRLREERLLLLDKLVLMTGGLTEEDESAVASRGARRLAKPFTPRELRAFVAEMLE
jgi:CheY-like chemotaxis protein